MLQLFNHYYWLLNLHRISKQSSNQLAKLSKDQFGFLVYLIGSAKVSLLQVLEEVITRANYPFLVSK